MNRDIFVLGGNGFVGRSLCSALVNGGYCVVAGVRTLPDQPIHGVTYQVEAFDRPEHFDQGIAGCDTVVHVASASTVSTNAANPRIEGNLTTTLALLEALQSKSPKANLLYLSSAGALYGDSEIPSKESVAPNPRSYHGASKFAAECFIKTWTNVGYGNATVLRPGNLYGPGQHPRKGFALVPTAMSKILHDEHFEVWGNGDALRDYLYIDDFVELILRVIDRQAWQPYLVLNAGSGISHATNEVLALIEKACQKGLTLQHLPTRVVDAQSIRLNVELAKATFDWTPTTPLEIGLAKTWDWYLESTENS